jgi:two-component system alkaline phosphatase synthesis response regulator PhoP
MTNKKNKSKILVIDDEPALLNILRIKLEQEGYKFFGARSGQEGLGLAKKEKPHLILLDLIMPEMDGFAVLARLKKIPEAKKSKIVILSVSGRDEDIKRGFRMGVAGYLVKTKFTLEEMIEKVKECLGGKC